MKNRVFLFILFVIIQNGFSQTLKPSIGITSLPPDAATICAIPTYTGSFTSSGYQAGDTIPHFLLYDKNGVAFDILTILQTGKPLLLIGGNYTCPAFRQKINKINSVAATYSNQINIFVVYGVEAHPKSPDFSPYSGTLWVTGENQNEPVLYLQPTTYGGRKQLVNDMLANPLYTLSVPVLIDGTCNAWWQNFGPAPNNAYLIKPNGVVFKKEAWFDKAPDNINTDITDLLNATDLDEVNAIGARIYPNPASAQLNFEIGDNTNNWNITIRNTLGQQVEIYKDVNEKVIKLNTASYSKGLYFYELLQNGKTATGKFFVN